MRMWRRTLAGIVMLAGAFSIDDAMAQGYRPVGVAPAEEVLVFGVHPYSNPQDLFKAYDPIMRYVESKVPGLHLRVEASRDYAEFEDKLARGSFHFALPNPYETVLSLSHGYRVIAKMTPDEDFRGLLLARRDRGFRTVGDLKGAVVAFPSPTAVAGAMLPMLTIHDQGLDVHKDIQAKYVGSQFSTILNAYNREVDACASTVRFWRVWSRDNPDKAKEMVELGRSTSLPHNGVVVRRDVDPTLGAKVAAALAGLDKDGAIDQSQFHQDQGHFELADDATYAPMRAFLERYDRAIGLPAAMRPIEGRR